MRTGRIQPIFAACVGLALAVTAAAASATPLPNLGSAVKGTQLVYKGYYDHHIDTYLLTDVSDKAQATGMRINFSAALATVKGLPLQYFVRGRAAPGQITIFGSEPGKPDYNPLWEEEFVTWKPGVTPVLLGRDDQINALAKAGKLTVTDEHIVLNAPILTVGK